MFSTCFANKVDYWRLDCGSLVNEWTLECKCNVIGHGNDFVIGMQMGWVWICKI